MASAAALVKRHGHMPRSRAGSLLWLAEARPDVAVCSEPLAPGLCAYALRGFGQQRILLNDRREDPYPWLTLAHELGHLELGAVLWYHRLACSAGGDYWERRCEREANAFAAELLLSRREVLEIRGLGQEELEARLAVPAWLVRIRLERLGLVRP